MFQQAAPRLPWRASEFTGSEVGPGKSCTMSARCAAVRDSARRSVDRHRHAVTSVCPEHRRTVFPVDGLGADAEDVFTVAGGPRAAGNRGRRHLRWLSMTLTSSGCGPMTA